AITAPPYPSDGFPASAALADATPRPTRSVGCIQQCGRASPQLSPEPVIRQRVFEERGAVALQRADVVAPLAVGQWHRDDAATLADDLAQGVRELDLAGGAGRSEEHTSELQSPDHLVCR